jgi:muramoyltetrapeptide carboxypeptidase
MPLDTAVFGKKTEKRGYIMQFPEALKKGDTIGITAPSSGVSGIFAKRLDNAIMQLRQMGYEYIETKSVRNTYKLTSATPKRRAEEFMSLYINEKVKIIIPPWGGEFLMDMLPYLDYEVFKGLPPKWIMGFSDTSTLLFSLTTKCDIATIHGPNLMDFGSTPIDESVLNALRLLQNRNSIEQKSIKLYQKTWADMEKDNKTPYQLTEKVEWKLLGGGNHCNFRGRLIGGCMDTICKLIGTPYESVEGFMEKYKDDGVIWYLESCEMKSTDIYRTLWQMKMNGWFSYCKGIIYGRPDGYSDVRDFNFVDSLRVPLEDLSIPIIYHADIGHLPPQLTFVNGANAVVEYHNGEGRIIQDFI